ncbi:hypothetical protein CPB84DRAFT_374348 [Gymnopilus junonius]|uniref:Uncharacterized protein n=1 Tax=Gymnopilus junonius TaxID=109634 RepID=A0A9P5NAM5_GYMJU|nr:hypothetical protein CPB84DRAFT_374348 [Gymnopilus junonius]
MRADLVVMYLLGTNLFDARAMGTITPSLDLTAFLMEMTRSHIYEGDIGFEISWTDGALISTIASRKATWGRPPLLPVDFREPSSYKSPWHLIKFENGSTRLRSPERYLAEDTKRCWSLGREGDKMKAKMWIMSAACLEVRHSSNCLSLVHQRFSSCFDTYLGLRLCPRTFSYILSLTFTHIQAVFDALCHPGQAPGGINAAQSELVTKF